MAPACFPPFSWLASPPLSPGLRPIIWELGVSFSIISQTFVRFNVPLFPFKKVPKSLLPCPCVSCTVQDTRKLLFNAKSMLEDLQNELAACRRRVSPLTVPCCCCRQPWLDQPLPAPTGRRRSCSSSWTSSGSPTGRSRASARTWRPR